MKALAVAMLIAAVVGVACTGGNGGPTSSPIATRDRKAADTEGYSQRTFSFPPDRPPASRPTNPPPPAALPPTVPIDHVIFIVKENRTFDHYFGTYPGADGATTGTTIDGRTVPLQPAQDVMSAAITHGFWSGLFSIDGGRMDGFNTIVGGENLDGYSQFDRKTIPHYFEYADRFVLADHFFTSEYGPTLPEHLYTVAATSFGIMDNKTHFTKVPGRYCEDPQGYAPAFPQSLGPGDQRRIMDLEDRLTDDHPNAMLTVTSYIKRVRACLTIPSLPERLSRAGVSWKFYAAPQFPIGDVMGAFRRIRFSPMWNNVVDSTTFPDDIRNGNLAQVSWVNPPAPYNEHPILPNRNQSVCAGENWTVAVMNALQQSPYWRSTAVIEVWDDFGGFYDHVNPPQYDIMGLGARAPALIMSPWTTRGSNRLGGSIDHHTYEFSSVLRFIEDIFGLAPLTLRDEQADPLTGAFDFSKPPDMHRLILPLRQDCPYGTHPPFNAGDNFNRSG
jgi:phospholipase C